LRIYPRSEFDALGIRYKFSFREVDDNTLALRPTIDYQSILATVQRDIPARRWSTQVGDVVNNIRAALDNLVFSLTDANYGPPPNPIPFGDRWRRVSFPVRHLDTAWSPAVQRCLWGLTPRQQGRLKKHQPFFRKKPVSTQKHWLSILEELWNADKHRSINVTRAYHGWESIEFLPPELSNLVEVCLVWARDFGSFDNDTEEIARVRLRPRTDRLFTGMPNFQFEVKVRLTFEVTFDSGPPAYGANIVELLKGFMNRVVAIVHEFEPGLAERLPLNVLAPPAVRSTARLPQSSLSG
jgi:hypothetical protein